MKSINLKTITILVLAGCCFVYTYKLFRGYHEKTAWLQTVKDALLLYADDNGGRFPNRSDDPFQSLDLLLNRKYLPDFEMLSGFTGRLCKGCATASSESSWVYIPGYTTNSNADIAIIWDRKIGLDWSGRSSSRHYYVTVRGEMRAVDKLLWNQFLIDQESLRKAGHK